MARVLVTGGAGFIGSHLTDALLAEGHKVIVLDNLSRGKLQNVNIAAEFHRGDIREKEIVDKLVNQSDIVYHLAFLARVRPSIEDPVGYNDVNLTGTLNVLDACRRFNKKIIFASSSSVFGEAEPPFTEETKFAPMNPYAMQKLMCEMYIRLYHDLYNLDYTILRYFNVYGSRQIIGGSYSTVIGTFIDQRSRGEPLTIFGDGEQKRDFTHIEDIIDANLLAINYSGEFWRMKAKKPKIERLRVLRADFQMLTVLKDDLFTKKGKIRKQMQKAVTDLIKYDAHYFIDRQDFDSIIQNATIEYEDVEIEETDENKS